MTWQEAVKDVKAYVAQRDVSQAHRRRQTYSGNFSSATGCRDLIDDQGPMGLYCLHPRERKPGQVIQYQPAAKIVLGDVLHDNGCAFDGCVCACHVEQAP